MAQDPYTKTLDAALLSGRHSWTPDPESEILFRHYVHENQNPRLDMQRYRMICAMNAVDAKRCFSRLCNSETLFKIPSTILCDRTFARDAEEAYYLDAMDEYLSSASGDLYIQDLPFSKRQLESRLHCAFSRRAGYFSEHYERRRLGVWLLFDAYENEFLSDAYLTASYPKVEAWLEKILQPTAMPIPTPFVVYYFHNELREAQRARNSGSELSERTNRLLFCLEKEFYIFFVGMWMIEASYGRRQFVLPSDTIDVLEKECGSLSILSGQPVPVIIAYMRSAANGPEAVHNWIFFKDYVMEESTFVWAVLGTGEFAHDESPGLSLWTSKGTGKLTVHEHSSAIFKRNTVLEKILSGPDMDKVEGLRTLVREQRWDRYGSINIGTLLERLVQLVSFTQGLVPSRNGQSWPRRLAHHAGNNGLGDLDDRHGDEPCQDRYRDSGYDRGDSGYDGWNYGDHRYGHQYDDGRHREGYCYDHNEGRYNERNRDNNEGARITRDPYGQDDRRYTNPPVDYRNPYGEGRGNAQRNNGSGPSGVGPALDIRSRIVNQTPSRNLNGEARISRDPYCEGEDRYTNHPVGIPRDPYCEGEDRYTNHQVGYRSPHDNGVVQTEFASTCEIVRDNSYHVPIGRYLSDGTWIKICYY